MKDVQTTGEACSPQKRTSSTSKHEISKKFVFLWVVFAAPGSGSGSNADTKHWFFYPVSWCAAHTVSYTTMGQRLLSTCPPRLKGKHTFTFLF